MSALPSVRARLVRHLLGWLLPVCAMAGVSTYAFVWITLTSQFDSTLRAKARAIAAATHLDPKDGSVDFDFGEDAMPEFSRKVEPEFYQVWAFNADGRDVRRLNRSSSLGEGELPSRVPSEGRAIIENLRLPDGRSGRAVWMRLRTTVGKDDVLPTRPVTLAPRTLLVCVSRDRSEVDRALGVVMLAVLAVGSAAVVLAWIAVRGAVRGGLAPLADLSTAVEGIDPSRLPQRIALPPMPLELAAIADRLERLVGRVRETVAREKRFTGSAAHELRTPLAEIRALLDVRLKWPEDRAACLATMAEVRAINVRMEGLTSLLLQLARGEASRPATAPAEAVDATALLGDLLERHGEMGRRRGLRVSRPDGEAFWVRTDPAGLRSVLENLVINAMTHAPAGSAVEAGADLVGDRAELWIRNPAGRLTPDDLPRLFEPFWQKEEGRTPAHESVAHAGLGLAIARGIAARLGMELRADLRDGLLTFRVSIALPRLAPAFVDSGGPPSADVDVEPVPALPAAALAHPDD